MSGRDKIIHGVVSYWAPLIVRYLSAYCQGHDCDLDDIRSDLWVMCIEKSTTHDKTKASLRTYLDRCCHGHLLHMLRDAKATRGRYVYFDDCRGSASSNGSDSDRDRDFSADDFAAPSDAQDYLLTASTLLSVAARLCANDRAVAKALAAAPDSTQHDIAVEVGVSQFTVSKSLGRIRAAAARELSVA